MGKGVFRAGLSCCLYISTGKADLWAGSTAQGRGALCACVSLPLEHQGFAYALQGFFGILSWRLRDCLINEKNKLAPIQLKHPFKGYCMEASKCPIGMLWFILSVPVYRVRPDQADDSEDWTGGQVRLPDKNMGPNHIRPPPLRAGSR